MLLRVNSRNPQPDDIRKVVQYLKDGGVIIYPTDTVYGIGCDINHPKAIERIARIKGIKVEKANFTLLFHDLSHLSDFTLPLDNVTFKLMKKALPGPFTFILKANNNVPKLFKSKKKTVGIRIPNNLICQHIVKELGRPIMNTSVHDEDEILEYTTDPELIYDRFKEKVDLVVAGDYGNNEASTVVDCSEGEIEVIRQGLGNLEEYI